jgi:hypothetical protein
MISYSMATLWLTSPLRQSVSEMAPQQVQVNDVETITGTLNQTSINENAGASVLTWTLSRSNSDQSLPLVVQLASSDTTELTVPTTATIAAGSSSVIVPVTVQDDSILDGNILVTLSASAAGYRSNNSVVSVVDVESLQLIVDRRQLQEKTPGGLHTSYCELEFSGSRRRLRCSVNSFKNGSKLSVCGFGYRPPKVASVEFDISAIDDYAVEGLVALQLLASGSGVSPASVDLPSKITMNRYGKIPSTNGIATTTTSLTQWMRWSSSTI